MASNGIRMKQFRYYSNGNDRNTPFAELEAYTKEVSFSVYKPIQQLGIQTLPGTRFYINDSKEPIVIGQTGIYELDLRNTTAIITSLRFDKTSMEIINNVENGYLIVDIVYTDLQGVGL